MKFFSKYSTTTEAEPGKDALSENVDRKVVENSFSKVYKD
jgi:hypothetical protein